MGFHGLPGSFVLVAMFSGGLWIGLCIIRIVYFLHERPSTYRQDVHLCVLGLRVYRILLTIFLLCTCLLGARVGEEIPEGKFYNLASLSKSWWCIVRILVTTILTIAGQVFDSHPALRLTSLGALPLLALMDMISHVSFVSEIECIEEGICDFDSTHKSTLYALAWRDIFGYVLGSGCAILAFWLTALTGFFTNRLFVPKLEHRILSQKIERMIKSKKQAENNQEKSQHPSGVNWK